MLDQSHSSETCSLFHAWQTTGRMLVVINETFEIVKELNMPEVASGSHSPR